MNIDTKNEERKVKYIRLEDILPNRFQPRIKFDEQALNELSASIKEHGVLSPITVRPLGDKYEIIAGERRYKATAMAGLATIPALVVEIDDKESAEIALIENVQRKDLTPIEEAISYKKIFDMNIGISQEELAKKLGKSQSTIANKLRLLNLSDEVQEALLEGHISERHARSLLKIKEKSKQNQLLEKIIKERLTVRKTDEIIMDMMNNKEIEVLDFDLNDDIKIENISSPIDRFNNLYNLPATPIVEDKEDNILPQVPEVADFKLPGFEIEQKNDTEMDDLLNNQPENFPVLEPLTIASLEDNVAKEENGTPLKQNLPEEDIILPGFMDISKIETEATDINDKPNKISLEDLLNEPSDKTTTIEEEITTVSPPQTNRFFTMFDEEKDNNGIEEDKEENNIFNEDTESDEDGSSTFTNTFNFDTIPTSENKFSLEELLKSDNNNQNEITNLSINTDSSEDTPVFENAINPVKLNDEDDFSYFDPLDKKDENIQNTPLFDKEDDPIINNEIIEDEEEEIIDFPKLTSNEELDVPSFNFDNEDNTSVSSVKEFDYTPIYEESERQDMVEEENSYEKYGADLKTVINTVRNCADTIEKYGYVVDTEEFDFEDMYQVIFKIEKKN